MLRSKRSIEGAADQQEIEDPKATQAWRNSSIITHIRIRQNFQTVIAKKARLRGNLQTMKRRPSLRECRPINNGRTPRRKEMKICLQCIKSSSLRVKNLRKLTNGKVSVEKISTLKRRGI